VISFMNNPFAFVLSAVLMQEEMFSKSNIDSESRNQKYIFGVMSANSIIIFETEEKV